MSKRSCILFFIPGNPGLSSYYRAFFKELKAKVPGIDIITTNHIGFNPDDGRRDASSIDLSAQIAHKIDLLDGIAIGRKPEEKDIPIYVAGHSVGAYMATKVLAARPELVDHLFLLFPTMSHIGRSRQGRIATVLLSIPFIIQFLSLLTWTLSVLVPANLRLNWVKRFTKFPDNSADITAFEVLTRNNVYTALTLALTEMREINEPDTKFWSKYADRCTSYWARHDHWVQDNAREELIACAPAMENYFCDEAPHAFCVSHNELVAKRVADWIAAKLP